jgi:cyclase
VVVSIDARRLNARGPALDGRTRDDAATAPQARGQHWEVVVHGGRTGTGRDVVAWAAEAAARGAGEILLTSIDRDGTRGGYDLPLLRAVTAAVPVPVVASGGAGSPDDLVAAILEGGADAVLAASIFHRDLHGIATVKHAMAAAGIPVRLARAA